MGDELIRKSDVIEIMENLIYDMSEVSTIPQLAKQSIENLPSVQQKQTLAYWIGKELGECSNCGHNGCSSDIWNGCLQMFCPNCGARMEERAEQVSERGGNG